MVIPSPPMPAVVRAEGYADGSTATASFRFLTDIAWVPDGRLFVVEAMTALADGRVFVLATDGGTSRLIYEINAAGSTVTLHAGDPDGELGPEIPIDGDALETGFRVFNAAHAALNGTDLLVVTNQGALRIIETVVAPVDLSTSLTTFSQQRATAVVFDSTTIQGAFIDADADVLSYSIVSSTPLADLFTISASSGLIRMARTPADDESSTHTLIVTASDSSASVATTATVVLSPFNHPPVVTLATTTISVEEDFNPFSVGLITASNDGDNDGTTQTISYSIDPAAVAFATVSIAAQSGTLTLSAVADAFGTATLTVTAADSGTENAQSTTEVLLVVRAVNDAPNFTLSTSVLVLDEDFGSAQVTVVSSDDGDTTVVQPLSYAISTTSIGFANLVIDADSGTLTLSSVLNQFGSTVTVTVDDGDIADNIATQVLSLTVVEIVDGLMAVTVGEYVGGLHTPEHVLVLSDGRLFVADSGNSRVAVISADGNTVSTYAGAGEGDADGSVAAALFGQPQGVVIAGRTVFVADTNNDLLRVVDVSASTVSTFAGLSGSEVVLDAPVGVGVSTDGRQVFVADQNNARIVVAQTGNALPTIVLSTENVSLSAGFADFTITVLAMDEGLPLSWQVTVEDNTVLTATTSALSIRLSSVANQTGSARLMVHAVDDLGAMVYRTIEVRVEEAAPAPEPTTGGGGGGGAGCSLQPATGASDWTLWLLLLLSLLALRLRPRYL